MRPDSSARLASRLQTGVGANARATWLMFDEAMIRALLAAVPAEAFVVDATLRVRHANDVGRAALVREGDAVATALRDAIHGGARDAFEVTPIAVAGRPGYYLAVRRGPAPDEATRLRTAIERWKLTPRQGEVLALLARGESNKRIAAMLGCTPRTVEVHISRMLANIGVDNRAALITLFWSS